MGILFFHANPIFYIAGISKSIDQDNTLSAHEI